jgi:ribonuclease BN (tRNA processing enzyme)
MKLAFPGTRGNIEAKTNRHRRHTNLMVSYKGKNVLIDCGEDWKDRINDLNPDAIVITHAHPDHSFGLKEGAPCPVYAPEDAYSEMKKYKIEHLEKVGHRKRFQVRGISFEAFPVEHSIKAPAVGYRINAGRHTVFYAPDLVYIYDRKEALEGATLYIGDGATIKRSFVRKRGDNLIGHTPVQTQLTWCRKERVPKMIITHCGSQIVEGDERKLGKKIREMASERGVEAEIAYDGMEILLR